MGFMVNLSRHAMITGKNMTSLFEAVQNCCLSMPETEEKVFHGFPIFKVTGKQFATYSLLHHGDGKVALLLNAFIVSQHMLVDAAPDIFFKPPYVGHKGSVGVELNKGLKWPRIQQLTYEAYVRAASDKLARKSSGARRSSTHTKARTRGHASSP